MLQQGMIERFREAFRADERVVSALMFGSFAIGEGDAYSDVEFAVFVADEHFDGFDPAAWLDAVSPVAAYFPDDHGHHTALFHNGVRGEFHFLRASQQSVVEGWKGHGWFRALSDAVMLDRTGELSRHARALVGGPPERGGAELVRGLSLNLINHTLMGAQLLRRGEWARAWAVLPRAHENLLKLVRLQHGATDHWPTPSRAFERDLPAPVVDRYVRCTAAASPRELPSAYRATWSWARELFAAVAAPLGVEVPASTLGHVDALLAEAAEAEGA